MRPLLLDSAIAHRLLPIAADRHQALQQLVLGRVELFVVELTCRPGVLELEQAGPDCRLVGHLQLGLLLDPLGQPHGAADGGERERQETGYQTHYAPPMSRFPSAKLYGGSGPTKRTSIRAPTSSTKLRTRLPNAPWSARGTRNDRSNADSAADGFSTHAACAAGSSTASACCVSASRLRAISPATISPRRMRS